RPEPPDDLHAVDARQPEVEDDDVHVPAGQDVQGRLAVRRRGHLVASGREAGPDRPQDLRFVVDDEDPHELGSADRASASCTARGGGSPSVAPPPGVVSTHSEPSWAAITARAMDSPSPVPAFRPSTSRRETPWNTAARPPVGMPGPWSDTRTSAHRSQRIAEMAISDPGGE